ncbi:MAG: acetate kinase [Clostridium sp.]|nr:acetate kinase [Clostridium sp.]MCM1398732.1 acetate kinase [Clostridium sp.]MCM1458636.1 acetate kinase [Bacteroides sp.]
MKVLVINCGSSSLKYQLIDSESEKVLAKGICERIKLDGTLTHQTAGKDKLEISADMPDHSAAVRLVLDKLTDKEQGAIASLDEINAIGHRVVHGGEKFAKSALIDADVLSAIEECNDLAPLHNPANLIGIKACMELMPGVPQVAVFDTAFHQTMPSCAYIYGLPYEYYEKYKVRRYGFHGTSHSFVSKRTAELLGKKIEDTKIIVCHLGGGSSICAVKYGQSVDTTMGLTPLEGIPMGTRSGTIDPAIIEFIAGKENKTISEVMDILNKQSGVYGISGVSSDFRDLNKGIADGNERCDIAMKVFCYQVSKIIGGYVAAMDGVDAIVFTAGVGENDPLVRKLSCSTLTYLGIAIDDEANKARGEEVIISTKDSRVPVYVVPTNEELAIARETVGLI